MDGAAGVDWTRLEDPISARNSVAPAESFSAIMDFGLGEEDGLNSHSYIVPASNIKI